MSFRRPDLRWLQKNSISSARERSLSSPVSDIGCSFFRFPVCGTLSPVASAQRGRVEQELLGKREVIVYLASNLHRLAREFGWRKPRPISRFHRHVPQGTWPGQRSRRNYLTVFVNHHFDLDHSCLTHSASGIGIRRVG